MDKRNKGAWLLAHSKNLDLVTGTGALRLEHISYAGKVGRLYNVLRRGSDEAHSSEIDARTVATLCQLNNLDLASRRDGLRVLQSIGRIDVSADGSVAVLGATCATVLEAAADIFDASGASKDEDAVLFLSNDISVKPLARREAEEKVSDLYRIDARESTGLVDLCKETALIDEETGRGDKILFNSNTFRDRDRATKAYYILQSLKAHEASRLSELEELLRRHGAVYDVDAVSILGEELYRRLAGVGYFDRMEVNNSAESVGYIALPDAFQRYGRPFEEDPVDDAKALLASLTYGMKRSTSSRGQIMLPLDLINALIAGREIGGQWGVTAIGQDYRELEKRGVVKVIPAGRQRFRMTLLKPDVGQLARAIIEGGQASEETLLIGRGPATGFKGPDAARKEVRKKSSSEDNALVADMLDQIRSGG